jgi:hypothetical protein
MIELGQSFVNSARRNSLPPKRHASIGLRLLAGVRRALDARSVGVKSQWMMRHHGAKNTQIHLFE